MVAAGALQYCLYYNKRFLLLAFFITITCVFHQILLASARQISYPSNKQHGSPMEYSQKGREVNCMKKESGRTLMESGTAAAITNNNNNNVVRDPTVAANTNKNSYGRSAPAHGSGVGHPLSNTKTAAAANMHISSRSSSHLPTLTNNKVEFCSTNCPTVPGHTPRVPGHTPGVPGHTPGVPCHGPRGGLGDKQPEAGLV